jgi:3-hydroxyisobutyrate dehydrogenase
MNVGFIGVGQMGRPMVDRLVAAAVPVEVFVRRSELRADLEAAGVEVAESMTALAARSDLLIVCLFDDDQVRDVLFEEGVLAAMRPGSIVANHVTGSPELAVEIEARAPEGVTFLDVPISGTAAHIARGELTLMVGGDAAALDRARDVFAAYAEPILHVGGVGDGQRMKLVNNLLFAVNLRAALDAAELGRSLGIEPAELARVLAECSGASFALDLLQAAPPEAWSTSVRRYLAKDVAVIQDVATQSGIDLGELGSRAAWVFAD